MKALFVSDNHGDAAILTKIAAAFSDQVDAMFHCGDSNLAPNDPAMAPFVTVAGNTDWGLDYPARVVEAVGDQRILVTHGHAQGVNQNLLALSLLAQEDNATIAAYGHTHQLACELDDHGILLLNPGSISQPRGEYSYLDGTFAVIESRPDRLRVKYYNRDLVSVGLDQQFRC